MKTNAARLKMIFTVITISTVTAACGGGSLPPGLETSSSNAPAALTSAAAAELLIYVGSPSILVGGTSSINAVGGTPPYSVSASSGSLSASTFVANQNVTFTGGVAGNVTITVTDSAGQTKTTPIAVNAPVATVSTATRALYLYALEFNQFVSGTTVSQGTHHRLTDSAIAPAGWTAKGISLYVYINQVAGTVPLYSCLDTGGQNFESTAANCEGYAVVKSLGFIYPPSSANVAGTAALTRSVMTYLDTTFNGATFSFSQGPGGQLDHIATIYPALSSGYTSEGVIGYAPSALLTQ